MGEVLLVLPGGDAQVYLQGGKVHTVTPAMYRSAKSDTTGLILTSPSSDITFQDGQELVVSVLPTGEVDAVTTLAEVQAADRESKSIKTQASKPKSARKKKWRMRATLRKEPLDMVTLSVRFGTVQSFDTFRQEGVIKSKGQEFEFLFEDKGLIMVYMGELVWVEDDRHQISYYPQKGDRLVFEVIEQNDLVWAWTLPNIYEAAFKCLR